MKIEEMIPPGVMDIVRHLRDDGQDLNYRENLAARLELIAQVAEAEVRRFRDRGPVRRRKRG